VVVAQIYDEKTISSIIIRLAGEGPSFVVCVCQARRAIPNE